MHKPVVNLPTLKKLSSEGLTLRRCYTNSPQCVPARFSWITGLEPSQLGVTKNEDVSLPLDAPSKIRELQRKGWATTIVGKTHWSSHYGSRDIRESQKLINELGFSKVIEIPGPRALKKINCQITDDWNKEGWLIKQRNDLKQRYEQHKTEEAWKSRKTILPNHLYPDIWISNRAKEEIQILPKDKPWILWVSFVGPHEPFDTPKPWRGKTSVEELPEPIQEREWIRNLDQNCELKRIEKKWRNRISAEKKIDLRRDYADHLHLLDDQLASIINKISKRKDFKKTSIVVMSDHGEMLGDGGMLYKSTFLESSIRVPMIYRPPGGYKKGKECRKPVNTTTILNVILDNLVSGGNLAPIRKEIQKIKGAVIEYANEKAFIQKRKKICLDDNGRLLWATDIKKDPKELVNIAYQARINKGNEWMKIIKWGEKITRERRRRDWIWRDLIKKKYDQIEDE